MATQQNSVTIRNLESAFAGESMAHIKYRYFARIAPGTRWEDVPADWVCPECGVVKADFDMVAL